MANVETPARARPVRTPKQESVTLTIPAIHSNRVIDALCKGAGLESSVENAREAIVEHVRRTVANVEEGEARQAAEAAFVKVDVSDVVT